MTNKDEKEKDDDDIETGGEVAETAPAAGNKKNDDDNDESGVKIVEDTTGAVETSDNKSSKGGSSVEKVESITGAAKSTKDDIDEEKDDGNNPEKKESFPSLPSATVGMDEDGGITATVGSVNIRINQMRLPLVGMLISSCVLLISVLLLKGEPWRSVTWEKYAIAYPCVTLALCFIALVMTYKATFFKNNGKYLYIFLFVWNFVGASLVTFINPFVTTGNGYFSAWGIVLCALGGLGIRGDTFAGAIRGLGCIMGLISSSIIVIIAVTNYLGKDSQYRNESIYIMVVSCFTLIIFLAYIFEQKRSGGGGGETSSSDNTSIFHVITLGIFAILWLVLALIATFQGPFLSTSNGYFASWMGAACACYAVTATRNQPKDKK